MTEPPREDLLAEGAKQARIQGVEPEQAGVYAQGWAAAMATAGRAIDGPSRDRVVQRIVNAIETAANDEASDLAEAVYKAIQPLLSNVLWWRDSARQERDQLRERILKVREALHIADSEDRTDWQRGYRAAAERALAVLDGEGEKA